MKFKIYIALFILFVNTCSAQPMHVSVSINTPYSLFPQNYIQRGGNVTITIINPAANPRSVRIYPSLQGVTNGIEIKVKQSYVPTVLYFGPGEMKRITLNHLQALSGSPGNNDIFFKGYNSRQYFNNGTLPEGLYRLCMELKVVNDNNPSPFACTIFSIKSYDPPIILNPKNNEIVNQLNPQNILFNWTPSGIPGKTRYIFKLVDLNITPVNNPNDAFKKNVLPFFQQNNVITNTLVYDNTKPNLIDGHIYALEITSYDPFGNFLYKNYGRSQVSIFTYKKRQSAANSIKKIVGTVAVTDTILVNSGYDNKNVPDKIVK